MITTMIKQSTIFSIFFVFFSCPLLISSSLASPIDSPRLRNLFDAIRNVETGGEADPENAVGDGGKSIGPYQISQPYWYDAVHRPGKSGDRRIYRGVYEDVKNKEYAERVMWLYWDRYKHLSGADLQNLSFKDAMNLSRQHNGGPQGHRKKETWAYWVKVRNGLDRNLWPERK
jgi:hypothetical protein